MKKTGVIIILICTMSLLFITPVFASDNVWASSYNNIIDSNMLFYIRGTSSAWDLVAAEIDIEYMYSFTQSTISSFRYSATHSQTTGSENGVGYPTYSSGGTLSHTTNNNQIYIWRRNIVLDIGLNNSNPHAAVLNNYYKNFTINDSNNYGFSDFDIIYNPYNIKVYPNGNNFVVYFQNLMSDVPTGSFVIDKNMEQSCVIGFTMYAFTTSNTAPSNSLTITTQNNGFTSYAIESQYDNKVMDRTNFQQYLMLESINNKINEFLNAYNNNAQNIASTESQINSTQNTIDQVHQNEVSWYQANESAITEVGLSNSSLSDNQYQGVYPVANTLSSLWVAIGPVKYIYLFTLMASLSAFMLRHRPFTKIGGKVQSDLDSR